jgi:hypothetical protein
MVEPENASETLIFSSTHLKTYLLVVSSTQIVVKAKEAFSSSPELLIDIIN